MLFCCRQKHLTGPSAPPPPSSVPPPPPSALLFLLLLLLLIRLLLLLPFIGDNESETAFCALLVLLFTWIGLIWHCNWFICFLTSQTLWNMPSIELLILLFIWICRQKDILATCFSCSYIRNLIFSTIKFQFVVDLKTSTINTLVLMFSRIQQLMRCSSSKEQQHRWHKNSHSCFVNLLTSIVGRGTGYLWLYHV